MISQAWAQYKQAPRAGMLVVDVEHGEMNRSRECITNLRANMQNAKQGSGHTRQSNRG